MSRAHAVVAAHQFAVQGVAGVGDGPGGGLRRRRRGGLNRGDGCGPGRRRLSRHGRRGRDRRWDDRLDRRRGRDRHGCDRLDGRHGHRRGRSGCVGRRTVRLLTALDSLHDFPWLAQETASSLEFRLNCMQNQTAMTISGALRKYFWASGPAPLRLAGQIDIIEPYSYARMGFYRHR